MIDHLTVGVSRPRAQPRLLRTRARAARLRRDATPATCCRARSSSAAPSKIGLRDLHRLRRRRARPHRVRAPTASSRCTRSTRPRSPPAGANTALPARARTTARATTARSCSTPTATTSRPCSTARADRRPSSGSCSQAVRRREIARRAEVPLAARSTPSAGSDRARNRRDVPPPLHRSAPDPLRGSLTIATAEALSRVDARSAEALSGSSSACTCVACRCGGRAAQPGFRLLGRGSSTRGTR